MAEKQSQPTAQGSAQQGMQNQVPVQGAAQQGSMQQGSIQQGSTQQGTGQRGGRTQEAGLSRTGTQSRDMARQPYGGSQSPFSFMRRFMEDMDRLFGDFGMGTGLSSSSLMPRWGSSISSRAWTPQLEVFERQGDLVIRADLPGMKKDDVRVQIDDDMLTIEGERRYEHEETNAGIFHSERSYGSFQRAVQLPQGVNPESVKASFENGVLEITMPAPQSRPSARNIEVSGGGAGIPTGAQGAGMQGAGAQTASQAGDGGTAQAGTAVGSPSTGTGGQAAMPGQSQQKMSH